MSKWFVIIMLMALCLPAGAVADSYIDATLSTPTATDQLLAIDDPAGTWALHRYTISDVVALAAGGGLTNKLDATEAPDADNDTDESYSPGSMWIDVTNDKAYFCADATDGAAVWLELLSEPLNATTVTVTDNELDDEENPIVFVAGADPDGGDLGLETDGNCTYNPSTGTVTCTAFVGDGSGLSGVTASTALDDVANPDANKTITIGNYTFSLQTDTSGEIRIGDISGGNYVEFQDGYAKFYGTYYLQGSQVLSAVDGDGEYGGIVDVFTVATGTTASFGQVMHIHSDGELVAADDDAAATLPAIGLLVTAGTGTSKSLLYSGKVCEADWDWDIGEYVYVSGTPGTTCGMTQTVPSTNFGQIVGIGVEGSVADQGDCIMVNIQQFVGF